MALLLENRPYVLFYMGLGLLLLLWVLRDGLLSLFLLYVALLVILGLLGLIRLIQALLRKRCWKTDAGTDPKGET